MTRPAQLPQEYEKKEVSRPVKPTRSFRLPSKTPEQHKWVDGACAPPGAAPSLLPAGSWGHADAHKRPRMPLGGCACMPVSPDTATMRAFAPAVGQGRAQMTVPARALPPLC